MKLSRSYFVLEARVSRRDWDLALGLLYQLGVTTTEQRRPRGRYALSAQLPATSAAKSLLRDLSRLEREQLGRRIFHDRRIRQIRTGGWARKYLRHLRPFRLLPSQLVQASEPLWIDPRGRLLRRRHANTLYIESSLAFGTGSHTTTRLASRLLAKALALAPKRASVLDVGCGTGILAMVAKTLGAGPVDAVDNDPEALRVARHNFRANRIRGIGLGSTLIPLRRKYSVVVSNIGLNVLLELRPALLRRLAKEAYLILTGLLYRDGAELLRAYRGLKLLEKCNEGGWTAVMFQAKGKKF